MFELFPINKKKNNDERDTAKCDLICKTNG